MAFNGSGTFQPLAAPTFPAVAGSTILAARFNSNITDIHTGLTNCVTRNGQSPALADLPMAGFRLEGLGAGAANGQSVRYDEFNPLDVDALRVRGDTATEDLDDLTLSGTYALSDLPACTNIPTSADVDNPPTLDYGTVVVARGTNTSNEIVSQLLQDTDGRLFTRLSPTPGIWTNWAQPIFPQHGTFTPVIGGSTSESGQAYGTRIGQYVKFGKMTFIVFYAQLATKGSIVGNVVLKGMPATAVTTTSHTVTFPVMALQLSTNFESVTGVLQASLDYVQLMCKAAASTNPALIATGDIGTVPLIYFSGWYINADL